MAKKKCTPADKILATPMSQIPNYVMQIITFDRDDLELRSAVNPRHRRLEQSTTNSCCSTMWHRSKDSGVEAGNITAGLAESKIRF